MNILITGSSGMLGQALCKKLLEEHEIIGIDIEKPSAFSSQPSAFVQADISDRVSAARNIQKIKPDIIIHCAAYTDVDGCEKNRPKAERLNFEATANIALAAKQTDSFLIYMSTDFVFDGEKNSPYKEKDSANPLNIYGKTKLDGEKAIEKTLEKYLIVRTSWLFGKGGNNFVDIIIDKARTEKMLKIVSDQAGSPTYAVDLSDAINSIITTRGLQHAAYDVLHITNSGSCSWFEFAEEIIKSAQIKNVFLEKISSNQLNRPAKRPKMSTLDNAKFNEIYKKPLPHWKNALMRYIAKENNL